MLLLANTVAIWGKLNDVEILAMGEVPTDAKESLLEIAEVLYARFRSSTPQVPNEKIRDHSNK